MPEALTEHRGDGWSGNLLRREFIARGVVILGWGSFLTTLGLGAAQTLRFFFPRVLFLPPTIFRVGNLDSFLTENESADIFGVIFVDESWKASQRFFIVREQSRIYALSARCVHLGCTINWFTDLRIFRCPCHGSEYHSNGINFAGPAPRPLDRLFIQLDREGRIVVNTSIIYRPERFGVDGAFITTASPHS